MEQEPRSYAYNLRHLSVQDFLAFGNGHIAYIRPTTMNGLTGFAIHAADGTPLAFHQNETTARTLTRQNDMEPFQLN